MILLSRDDWCLYAVMLFAVIINCSQIINHLCVVSLFACLLCSFVAGVYQYVCVSLFMFIYYCLHFGCVYTLFFCIYLSIICSPVYAFYLLFLAVCVFLLCK